MALLGKKEDKHHRSAETVYDRVPGGQAETYGSHLKGRMTSESSIWQWSKSNKKDRLWPKRNSVTHEFYKEKRKQTNKTKTHNSIIPNRQYQVYLYKDNFGSCFSLQRTQVKFPAPIKTATTAYYNSSSRHPLLVSTGTHTHVAYTYKDKHTYA